jgi:hypothetical protein
MLRSLTEKLPKILQMYIKYKCFLLYVLILKFIPGCFKYVKNYRNKEGRIVLRA